MQQTKVLFFLLITFWGIVQCQPSKKIVSQAATNYLEHCGHCHGRNLEHLKEKGDKWIFGKTYEAIFKVTKEGAQEMGMPAWSAVLSDEEIKNLTNYILKTIEK
ncbi:MAG: c-type cytochrome [Saprospiraceae bacterium]